MKSLQLILSIFFLSTSFITSTSISAASAQEIPEPECKVSANDTACGYNCKISNNQQEVACAEWPGGKCKEGYHSVSCGPPAPKDWVRFYSSSADSAQEIPEPECKVSAYDTACGYSCKISNDQQEVACAEWPGGKCKEGYHSVSCGPPAPEGWERSYRRGERDHRDRDHRDRDHRDRDHRD